MTTDAIFPAVIDATMRSAFVLCPHHFFRRHCQGLTHDKPNIDLHFGACLAKGLEATRRAFCAGSPQANAVLIGSEALLREWGSFDYDPTTNKKTLENCLIALSDYFQEWPLATDPIQIHVHDGEPCIEFSGAWPIPGTLHPTTGEPILYAGRFDMIGDMARAVVGLDDKTTTGNIGSNWREQWKLRGQFSGYTWLANCYNLPITDFVIRGIQILTHSTKREMALVPRPKWMVTQWLWQLVADVNRMLEAWDGYCAGLGTAENEGAHPFSQNFDSGCFSYMRPCEHMDLCTSPHPERWENSYQIKYWNPLAREAQTL
jgi:hypothetical protein